MITYVYYNVMPAYNPAMPLIEMSKVQINLSFNNKYHVCRIAIITRVNSIVYQSKAIIACEITYQSCLEPIPQPRSILLQKRPYDKTGIYFGENSFITFWSDFFFCFTVISFRKLPKLASRQRDEKWTFSGYQNGGSGLKIVSFFERDAAGRKPCAQNESPFPIPRSIPRIVVTIWCFSPGGSVRPQNRATKDIRL